MRFTQILLTGLTVYRKISPFRRGEGFFYMLLGVCDKLGLAPPLIPAPEGLNFEYRKEVVLHDLYRFGAFEEMQTAALKKYTPAGGVFVDVGANVGYFAALASRWVGDSGQVFAFEPIPDTSRNLVSNLALNDCRNVQVFFDACSDQSGTAAMKIGKQSGWSHISAGGEGDIQVTTITLDEFLEKRNLERMDVLKIDTEGADLKVIFGARRSIERFRPVVLMETDHIGDFGHSLEDVESFFSDLGYKTELMQDDNSCDLLAIP
ncbi:hypothetical protein MNBD_GAMMA15-2631 [hydrothermal vent metagenome]|uniref:Methyltransferase FkbM domain-containing protein n=1 Tax=hydrothermal vent metagenome TaxID=652676 RepID=A0A3B0YL70_9ZZZZ